MGLRKTLRAVLGFNEPPERLALAFAIGSFIAFTPTVGLHTISAILIASLFRVNKVVAFAGTLISNPYTQIPIYVASYWFGSTVLGQKIGLNIEWGNLTLKTLWVQFKPILMPLFVGSIALGIVASIVSYFIFYYGIQRYRRGHPKRSKRLFGDPT